MGTRKKWSVLNQENMQKVPNVYGVYELADSKKNIICIGQGKLHERLAIHLSNFEDAKYFRLDRTGSKERAEQRERALLNEYERKHGCLPKYNKKRG